MGLPAGAEEKILAAIADKCATMQACPACSSTDFKLVDGLATILFEEQSAAEGEFARFSCVVLACSSCGFVRIFSLEMLGIQSLAA
jgi:hypothetical protein